MFSTGVSEKQTRLLARAEAALQTSRGGGEHARALRSPADRSEQEGQGNAPGKYRSLTCALLRLHRSDRPLQHLNYRTQLGCVRV